MLVSQAKRGRPPHRIQVVVLLASLFLFCTKSQAEELVLPGPPDVWQIALAPSIAVLVQNEQLDSSLGGTLHLLKLRHSPLISILGTALGADRFARADAYRLHLDFYVGTRSLAEIPVGIAFGGLVDLFDTGRPQVGARLTVWATFGVSPYLRMTRVSEASVSEFEVGIQIPFPVFRY